MDLMGQFSYKSQQGHKYILVAYHYDANAILAEPLKNWKAQTIANAWTKLHQQFSKAGVTTYMDIR